MIICCFTVKIPWSVKSSDISVTQKRNKKKELDNYIIVQLNKMIICCFTVKIPWSVKSSDISVTQKRNNKKKELDD